jgi:hypothetical protein
MPRTWTNKTGESSRALSHSDRRRLREFRARHAARLGLSSLSIPVLKTSMGAPFTWETLKRALEGKKVRADNYQFIKAFLDKYAPAPPTENTPRAALDRKSISAGEHEPGAEETVSVIQDFVRRGRDTQDAVDEAIRRGSR